MAAVAFFQPTSFRGTKIIVHQTSIQVSCQHPKCYHVYHLLTDSVAVSRIRYTLDALSALGNVDFQVSLCLGSNGFP